MMVVNYNGDAGIGSVDIAVVRQNSPPMHETDNGKTREYRSDVELIISMQNVNKMLLLFVKIINQMHLITSTQQQIPESWRKTLLK